MAIDKSLYEAPQGLGALAAEPDISVELDQTDEDGGVTVNLGGDLPTGDESFDDNLAEIIDDGTLMSLASTLLADYDADIASRRDWLETYTKGLDLLGLKYEERMEPWAGACGVTHPLLIESAVKFQSECITATFPAAGPVKTVILGKETTEKKEAATRVQDDMNYRLTEEMKEYRPEHERLLFSLSLAGNAFKKVYYDPSLDRQTALYVPAEDIVVPYGASSLENAERVTHRMRKTKNELRRLQVAGFYKDVDLGEPMRVLDDVEKAKSKDASLSGTTDNRFQLLEMHVELDLEGYEDKDDSGEPTGIALPYVVTIEKGTNTVLAIRRNWLEEDPLKTKRQHFVHYGYVPGFGFYYFGLIHLIGGHTKAATSLVRQLIDAGTLSNLPGGLKSRGLRVKGDDTPIAPGEFRDVDLPSGSIRDNILPLPYKEPSATLITLMDKVVDDARRMASTADISVSDMSSQAPVGTTLAVLERTLKVMSAVQARIHYAMKQEFKLLAAIIRDNTSDSYNYEPEVGKSSAKKADYDMVDVIPVSDPNASTMAQRVVQYQAVFQLAQSAPQLYDLPYLHRQMIEVLGIKNAEKIVPIEDDMKPVDPVSENMDLINGKPTKAFLYQDHSSHIVVHSMLMQDPKLSAAIGQSPNAQAVQAAISAHIMEHIAFQYRKDIEKQLGAVLPPKPEDDENYLTPEQETQLSAMAAQAADRLLQKDMAEVQMQQMQQQMQDPLIAMQQQDLKIKELEVQRKSQKDQMDAAAKADELALKEAELQAKYKIENLKLLTESLAQADELEHRDDVEGVKAGMDMMRHNTEQQNRAEDAMRQQMQGGDEGQPAAEGEE